jgi:hypothetical protein
MSGGKDGEGRNEDFFRGGCNVGGNSGARQEFCGWMYVEKDGGLRMNLYARLLPAPDEKRHRAFPHPAASCTISSRYALPPPYLRRYVPITARPRNPAAGPNRHPTHSPPAALRLRSRRKLFSLSSSLTVSPAAPGPPECCVHRTQHCAPQQLTMSSTHVAFALQYCFARVSQ